MTSIKISVTEFALPAPLTGSIDTYSGFSAGQLAGVEIHQEIQQQRYKDDTSYEAELWVQTRFTHDEHIFEVSGAMDGIYRHEVPVIEEIKSGFDLHRLVKSIESNEQSHPYCLQLKTYAYLYWLKTNKIANLNLLLVSTRNKKQMNFPIVFDIKKYEEWLERRLADLVAEVKLIKKNIKRRKAGAGNLVFPFTQPRVGQKELIASVTASMHGDKHLLIQAPTGLGKTIGVLYPVLMDSLCRGQKTLYLTPKNSQHAVAVDAVKRLQQQGAKIKSLVITSKSKICMKQEAMCNAEYCEFAADHYTKMTENQVLEQLQNKKQLGFYAFKEMAEKYQVCPYELQMDMIPYVDTVICDYNYVFSPNAMNNKVSKINLGEDQKQNIVIDEAHNLYSRAIDYYSPVLSILVLEKIGRAAEALSDAFKERFRLLIENCILILKTARDMNQQGPHLINPDVQDFTAQTHILREFLATYLESDVTIGANDCVLGLYNYWNDFSTILDWVSKENKAHFFIAFLPNPGEIRIICCDAADMLKSTYDQYEQVVGFSATMKPFDFYSKLMGLKSKKLQTEEFLSPFKKEQRKILLIPQISSRFADRQRNCPRVAEVIKRIASLQRGNYFAFFPSFDFLRKVLDIFDPPAGFKVLAQTPQMQHKHLTDIMNALQDSTSAHIVFAVQGGVLSEGVDYPGKLAIGAFIVGAPLPNYDWQRERMKQYYEQQYQAGVDYTYTYPAMAKAVQAAGRVIRTETDKGIIILLDDRFLLPNYAECMPQDWFEDSPHDLVSTKILADVQAFWQE